MLDIAKCPTCGSARIKRVRRDFKGEFEGQSYVVPKLTYFECPQCGEQVYDRKAMQRIAEHSPAYKRQKVRHRRPRKPARMA